MIKDVELANNILECIKTLQSACAELYQFAQQNDYTSFHILIKDAFNLLNTLRNTITNLVEEDNEWLSIRDGLVDNAVFSLNKIHQFSLTRDYRLFSKLEFEFLSMIDELYANTYFVALIKGDLDRERVFNDTEGKFLWSNRYTEESEKTGQYKYDVSIMITGYNKLEYTKQCIESVIKYTPSCINYELILVNHGSSDGTKEYFEQVGCTKQFDFLKNGIGSLSAIRTFEGKYSCMISNDVVVGPHYLENMIKCIESDDSIKWVVPTTTNISNFQCLTNIPSDMTFGELMTFAEKNNVSDPYRWEQRLRLCNPIELIRTADMCSPYGMRKYIRSFWSFGFGDDVASYIVRHVGGKCVLANDAFCYHFGSITARDDKEYNTNQNYLNGRSKFMNYFNIDPWDKGFCFSPALINTLQFKNREHVDILGINCGFGSDQLKIKETIKEKLHNLDVKTYSVTNEIKFHDESQYIIDEILYLEQKNDVFTAYSHIKFDYIIFEGDLKIYSDPTSVIKLMLSRLKYGGQLAVIDKNNLFGSTVLKFMKPDNIVIETPGGSLGISTWYIWINHKNEGER